MSHRDLAPDELNKISPVHPPPVATHPPLLSRVGDGSVTHLEKTPRPRRQGHLRQQPSPAPGASDRTRILTSQDFTLIATLATLGFWRQRGGRAMPSCPMTLTGGSGGRGREGSKGAGRGQEGPSGANRGQAGPGGAKRGWSPQGDRGNSPF